MPETTVRTPDGTEITVQHPEGATDQQILDYARNQYQTPPPASYALPSGAVRGEINRTGVPRPPTPVIQPDRSPAATLSERILNQTKRQAGLGLRALANVPFDAANVFAEPLAVTANMGLKLSGSDYRFPSQIQAVENVLTDVGFPEPESIPERISNFGIRLLGGMKTGSAVDDLMARGMGFNATPAAQATPTISEIRNTSRGAYQAVDDTGVRITEGNYAQLVDDLKRAFPALSRVPANYPRTAAALNYLDGVARQKRPVSFTELDELRQLLGDVTTSPEAAERTAAGALRGVIDDFMDNLDPSQIISGDSVAAREGIRLARETWRRAAKADLVDTAIQVAQSRGNANVSRSSFQTGLKTEFGNLHRRILRDPRVARMFSDDEIKAIKDVAEGDLTERALRRIGLLSFNHPLTGGVGFAGATLAGSPAIGGAMLLGGEAARQGSQQMTIRNARLLDELVRRGGALPARVSPYAAPAVGAVGPINSAGMSPLANYLFGDTTQEVQDYLDAR